MSWKHAGKLLSGPPIASGSSSNSNDRRFRPNLGGLNAFQREQQLASHYGSSRKGKEPEPLTGRTDWDVLQENHRFIRDDEEPGEVSWEERLARAYESKLFKEFALIDLKHYKSRRLALRWRTAEEVVEGVGEDTCASLRCKYHQPPTTSTAQVDFDDSSVTAKRRRAPRVPALRAFELPFVYQEAGERKEALVKVKLCRRCEAKLTWKPGKDEVGNESEDEDEVGEGRDAGSRRRDRHEDRDKERAKRRHREGSTSPRRDGHRADGSHRPYSRSKVRYGTDVTRSRSPDESRNRRLV